MRWGLILASVAIAVIIALAGTATWISSEAALRMLLDYAVAQSDGKLTIEEARGSLLGRIELARVRYRDGETQLTFENVTIDHLPRSLINRRLTIADLTAKRVSIDIGPGDGSAPAMPSSLALPIDLTIERARIEALAWRSGSRSGTLQDLVFAFDGDRTRNRLRDLAVAATGAKLTGEATVGTTAPFATQAAFALDLGKPHPEGRVQATLAGNFNELVATGKSTLSGIAADVRAKLAPFARQPFVEGALAATDVDLFRLDATLPVTRLALDVVATPAPDGFAGHATIVNSAPGPVDANRIPMARARAAFSLAGDVLSIRDLAAQAHGGASIAGSGSVNIANRENRWQLTVERLDLRRLHSALIETRLSGRIDADVRARVQRVVADVAQRDVRLAVTASYDGETIVAERLLARARDGSLEGSGRIALSGRRPFSLDVRAKQFDPSRFGSFPAGRLDGTIVARGTASPSVAAQVTVNVSPGSRLAGLPAQGRVQGEFTTATARAVDADLTLGSNRVQATGDLGKTGDSVRVKLAAKRLEELDPLLPAAAPKPVSGSLAGTATFQSLARGAKLEFDIVGTNLKAGPDWQFGSLNAQGRLTHAAPLSQLRVSALQDISVAAHGTQVSIPAGKATAAKIALTGSAASHTLDVALNDGDAAVEGRVIASLSGAEAAPSWSGRVESLAARGWPNVPPLALVTPATFKVERDSIVLDAFRIDGAGGQLDVESLRWVNGELSTSGRFTGLPIAPLLTTAGLADRLRTDLVLGGAWDVSSREAWKGTFKVARERGDVYFDDPAAEGASRVSLGLTTLALDATLEGTRITGHAQMHARLGGNALADFELSAPGGARHPFSADTRVNAKVRAHVPSLAAAQPWIGTSTRVQGQMIADVAIGGTIGKPALSGQLVGYGLRVDMPQFGVSYRDGQLRVASGPEGISLEELSFNAGDGRFFASGLLGLPTDGATALAKSQIRWRAENFRATNRPNLRLIVDGEGTLAMEQKRLVLRGKLSADEGNIEYRSTADTTLADDIVVVGRPRPARVRPDAMMTDAPLDLDLEIALGRNLRFAGEGLEARLAGRVHVTSRAGGAIQARGTIRTVRGTYHAFGQRLTIERGRVLFDGPIANPSLDIVALRKNLPVEAGVVITGTVRAPLVRLTSEPPVPDNEKLAWLLTGGPSGSGSARDSAALSAAAAALAGRGGKPITQRLAQSIGLDDISFAQRDVVDGADSVSNEVITLGKRISDRLYVAYERGVTLATDALRIEYVLSRYFTVSAFAGTESGVALSFRRNWP
jgi:translocation and assembly module TamB